MQDLDHVIKDLPKRSYSRVPTSPVSRREFIEKSVKEWLVHEGLPEEDEMKPTVDMVEFCIREWESAKVGWAVERLRV